MSDYTPDKWLMIKLTNDKNESHYRIFANWYGGYLGSDSWKLNSGVVSLTEDKHGYHFNGTSGSVYHCNKQLYGASGYGHRMLQNIIEQSKLTIEVIPEETNFIELNYK